MEYALLQAPYRTFLNNKITTTNITQQPLIIVYNLPTSLTEYLSEASQEESNYIRSSIYRSASASSTSLSNAVVVVVVTFDSKTSSFLLDHDGTTLSTAADAEEYLASCVFSQEQQQLQQSKNPSAATLSALTNLDQSAVLHLTQPALDTVVLLGNGGREHALAVALSKSPLVGKIICLPGNGGTQSEGGGKICNATTDMLSGSGGGSSGSSTPLTTMDNATVIQLVQAVQANMVVVGPEQPLVDGVVDELAKHCPSVKVFGPTMAGAQLEASKVRDVSILRFLHEAHHRHHTSETPMSFIIIQFSQTTSCDGHSVVLPRHSPKTFFNNTISPLPNIVTSLLPTRRLLTSNLSTFPTIVKSSRHRALLPVKAYYFPPPSRKPLRQSKKSCAIKPLVPRETLASLNRSCPDPKHPAWPFVMERRPYSCLPPKIINVPWMVIWG